MEFFIRRSLSAQIPFLSARSTTEPVAKPLGLKSYRDSNHSLETHRINNNKPICPCCFNTMLHHISNHGDYWFYRSCWQKMPDLQVASVGCYIKSG